MCRCKLVISVSSINKKNDERFGYRKGALDMAVFTSTFTDDTNTSFFHLQFIIKHIINCEELLCPVCSTRFCGDGQLDFPCFDIMLLPAESTDKNKVLKVVGEE